jgi:hypothetical protein
MRRTKGLRILLPIVGACAVFAGSVAASESVGLFVNGKSLGLSGEVKIVNGKVVAPVRALAEAMGGQVTWDKKTNSVKVTTTAKEDVADWIRKQGKEHDYYFDGLFVEEANLDGDPEAEVLARIDGGVHLGNFFVFDKQPSGTYQLIYEQPWRVEAWGEEYFRTDGMNPLFQIVTRTGGTGMDVREAHLMYMSDTGVWTESWKGTLKDRTVFQDNYHIVMGSYEFNDDNGELFYWQTEMNSSAENPDQVKDTKTTQKIFKLRQGRFVEQKH